MGFLDKLKRKNGGASSGPQTNEYSTGGSPIYRYKDHQERGFCPPEAECVFVEAIEKRFDEIFPDRESFVYHEIISDLLHIDIHILRPKSEGDCYIVYTTGMSDLPMNLPEEIADREELKYGELYMFLPGDWDAGGVGRTGKDISPENFWPFRLLKYLARFPHKYQTWLGWGHTIPNGPEYAPLGEGVGFGGAVLTELTAVPPLDTEDGKKIRFYMVVPAYKEEIEYKLKYGMEGLDQRFAEGKLPLVLDIHRPNFCADFVEILD